MGVIDNETANSVRLHAVRGFELQRPSCGTARASTEIDDVGKGAAIDVFTAHNAALVIGNQCDVAVIGEGIQILEAKLRR